MFPPISACLPPRASTVQERTRARVPLGTRWQMMALAVTVSIKLQSSFHFILYHVASFWQLHVLYFQAILKYINSGINFDLKQLNH